MPGLVPLLSGLDFRRALQAPSSCPDSFRVSTWGRRPVPSRLAPRCRETWMAGTSPGMTPGGRRRVDRDGRCERCTSAPARRRSGCRSAPALRPSSNQYRSLWIYTAIRRLRNTGTYSDICATWPRKHPPRGRAHWKSSLLRINFGALRGKRCPAPVVRLPADPIDGRAPGRHIFAPRRTLGWRYSQVPEVACSRQERSISEERPRGP